MQKTLLFVLLLTNYVTFAQINNCPKPEVYISSVTEDGEGIWDEYGTGLALCQGSAMHLLANSYNNGSWTFKSVRWTGPNSITGNASALKLSNLSAKHEGEYTAIVTFQSSESGCGTTTVTAKDR